MSGCGDCGACGGCCADYSAPVNFSTLSASDYPCTLIGSLVPCIDGIRQATVVAFGDRPYQVRLVWTAWSGGRRGVGVEQVLRVEQLTPTPLVAGIGQLQSQVLPIGSDEQGEAVSVTEISGRYAEEYLRGQGAQGQPIPPEQNFYYEVLFPRPPADAPLLRRFTLRNAPEWDPNSFGWKVKLARANEDRARNGDPQP